MYLTEFWGEETEAHAAAEDEDVNDVEPVVQCKSMNLGVSPEK